MGIGSGVVHDSDPGQEWKECLLKAHFLTKSIPDFYLFETLLHLPGEGYWLPDEHLERLVQSARYFCFTFSKGDMLQALNTLINDEDFYSKPIRVRLVLQKDGFVTTTFQPCSEPGHRNLVEAAAVVDARLPRIALSDQITDSTSPWFFHKTSNRELFQREYVRAREKGLFDIVFLNEKQEVTEGCISNLIAGFDGSYYTPPVSSGLLAGTMRNYLLSCASVTIQERSLNISDLRQADVLLCCNSVRGVVKVVL